MNQVKQTKTAFGIGIGIYAVVIEIAGVFFSEDRLSYTLGLLFGVIMAFFIFEHMAKTLEYALDLSESDAMKYVRLRAFLRLALMFAVLSIGMFTSKLNFLTVLLGLLGLKVGALMAPFILKRLYPEDYITKEEDVVPDEVIEGYE